MMYHLTPVDNLDSILEDGLEARSLEQPVQEMVSEPEYNHRTGRVDGDAEFEYHESGVYLSVNEAAARDYASSLSTEHYWDGEDHEFALLAVDVAPRNSKVFQDPEHSSPDDHITARGRVFVESIPVEDIEVVDRVVA